MTARREHKPSKVIKITLPPRERRGLQKMGLGGALSELNRALKGDSHTQREVERLCPPTSKLSEVFRSVSPKLSRDLHGRVVARFWSTLLSAAHLSEDLHKLTRIKGRHRREKLRSLLVQIHEVELWALRRQVEGLRRDIPRLLEQLTPTLRKRSSHNLKSG